MFLVEWSFWEMLIETEKKRKILDADRTAAELLDDKDFYEADIDAETHFKPVSDNPIARGPVYLFNDTCIEMRCGGSEEKRGLITLLVLGGLGPMVYAWAKVTFGFIVIDINHPEYITIESILLTLFMLSTCVLASLLFCRHGYKLTRLEMLTSRHLLIRFNRVTQQIYLHRPRYCGGIVTLPWKSTGSTAIDPDDDSSSNGTRLGLVCVNTG